MKKMEEIKREFGEKLKDKGLGKLSYFFCV